MRERGKALLLTPREMEKVREYVAEQLQIKGELPCDKVDGDHPSEEALLTNGQTLGLTTTDGQPAVDLNVPDLAS